jgi:hypothetical protein
LRSKRQARGTFKAFKRGPFVSIDATNWMQS